MTGPYPAYSTAGSTAIPTMVIAGASLAGWRAAQELREQGFDGRIVMVGSERHVPYDRAPLSKDFLVRRVEIADLDLASEQERSALDLRWRLGGTVRRLNTRSTPGVELDDGEEIRADGVIVATGASATPLPGSDMPPGAYQLRDIEDASAIREQLRPDVRLVVIGSGLLGAEAAATARALGARVTIVDHMHMPLVRTLGVELAPVCLAMHEDNGVRTRYGTAAVRIHGTERVTGVELADGRVLHADVVLVAVGATPNAQWLRGSGVRTRDGVLTDGGGMTRIPRVIAVGDVARYHDPLLGRTVRSQYWAGAVGQPRTAVRNLLAGRTIAEYHDVVQFWSEQYGNTLQFAGYSSPKDKITIVDGSTASGKFVATYRRAGRLVAVFAMNSPKQFAHYRRQLVVSPVRSTGPILSSSESATYPASEQHTRMR